MVASSPRLAKTIAMFDVDGTLTVPRKTASSETLEFFKNLRKHCAVAIVGGSDYKKICEQLGPQFEKEVDYLFSENGLVAFKDGELIAKQSFLQFMGEEKLQKFLDFTLKYIAELEIPQKRGTFIEFRNGMLNVSPIGRNCSQEERDNFEKYDKEAKVRPKMVEMLKKEFADFGLTYSIGGQISFDVFPTGWDKTYSLQFVEKDGFETIHFFGDKTYKGGNDYEIFESAKTIGHTVTSPEDTMKQVAESIVEVP